MLHPHYTAFVAYNRWANARLYDAAAQLPDEEFRRPMGAFFGSLCGTLNHLIVTDRIWLRMTGEGPAHDRLDLVLTEGIKELRALREAEDARIIDLIAGMNEADFARTYEYLNMSGKPFTRRYADTLPHFFNHQTHHRGQCHTLLTQLGQQAPALDYIYFLDEWETSNP